MNCTRPVRRKGAPRLDLHGLEALRPLIDPINLVAHVVAPEMEISRSAFIETMLHQFTDDEGLKEGTPGGVGGQASGTVMTRMGNSFASLCRVWAAELRDHFTNLKFYLEFVNMALKWMYLKGRKRRRRHGPPPSGLDTQQRVV